MSTWIAVFAAALLAAGAEDKTMKTTDAPLTAEKAQSVLDFTMKDIDGKDAPLKRYKGKVLLVVNVASKCGLTPQYEALQALHERLHGQGLAILGFPANNFRGQEPGTEAQIKEFCSSRYNVAFDLFSKVSVKGKDQCELYKFLTSKRANESTAGDIEWNFAKFVVDRDGKVIARFHPRVKPDDKKLIAVLERALAAKPAE